MWTTFVHRSNGRQLAADHQKSQQLLTEGEDDVLVWRCEVLQRAGFAQTPKDTTSVAEGILRKRVPDGTVGRRWVCQGFYKHRPEVKAHWSVQMGRVRALRGAEDNFKAIETFYSTVNSQVRVLSVTISSG